MATAPNFGKDTLMIYGFSFNFSSSARIEFHPKFEREAGELAVKSPTGSIARVTWGPLGKVANKLPTAEEHARFSLDQIRKGASGSMTSIEHKGIQLNGHEATYNHIKIEMLGKSLIPKQQQREVISLHIHCTPTSRYFIIYGESDTTNINEQKQTIQQIISSFRCHRP
jgi:hypothetical protein